jgi:soluble lytic murein transglycosylase-like protein
VSPWQVRQPWRVTLDLDRPDAEIVAETQRLIEADGVLVPLDEWEHDIAARLAAQQKLLDTHPYSYRELIEREAEANNLQPAFVAAIVLNESSFNPGAESSVGARGLMQMMPDTAEWVHGKIDADTDYSFDLMYDPEKNVTYACWYLA